MRKIISVLYFLYSTSVHAQPDTIQRIVPGRVNSLEQQQKPYLIIISSDGFRYDYAKKHGAVHLLALSGKGVRAESMIPSYPSHTFPNHYTIATGLYPSHHGLAANHFYSRERKQFYSMKDSNTVRDGSWYGGVPFWVLAEQQQMLSASFYWVGTEADVRDIRPTYYYHYNEDITMDRRIQVVVDWLSLPEEKRPHLITFYIMQTDHAGHKYGPGADKTRKAVQWVDSVIYKLTEAVKTTGLPVNFIFLADHGMTRIDNVNTLKMPSAIDTSLFYIPQGSEMIALYAKNEKDIKPVYERLKKQEKRFRVYTSMNMPEHLHYRKEDDRMDRIGDILLIPDWPNVFNFSSKKDDPGAHGFDPWKIKDMHAVFYAWGPNFKTNTRIPSFENIHVYPVVAKLLGLKYTEAIDGKMEVAEKIVR